MGTWSSIEVQKGLNEQVWCKVVKWILFDLSIILNPQIDYLYVNDCENKSTTYGTCGTCSFKTNRCCFSPKEGMVWALLSLEFLLYD